MTALFRCDQCAAILEEEQVRIEVTVRDDVAPDAESEDDEDEYVAELTLSWTGDHHFCTHACLAAWAYHHALTDEPTG